MNYYLKFSFSLLLIAFVFSCNDRDKVADNTAENVIKINDSELNKRYLASDVFESYTLIPLETNDDCLIGKCSKIIITDSIIHVFDDQSQSVYLFGMDGKYKTKIHNMGQGSNQYTEIYDFTLMKNGDLLILNFRKLIRLKNDGTPYKTYSLPFTSDAVENMDDTMMVFNGARFDDRVIIWDIIREKRINSYIKYDVKRSVRIFKPLIKYGDKIYFSRCYSSILYNVTQKELEKKWLIDFGKRTITNNAIVKHPTTPFTYYYNLPYTADMYQFTETECFITFSFACEDLNEGHPYYVYYSKVTGEKMIITYGLFDDDLTFAKYPPNLAMATDSEQFICSFDAYTLIEQVEEAKTKKMDDDKKKRFSTLVNKIKEIDETDNPVIVLYTLKKF